MYSFLSRAKSVSSFLSTVLAAAILAVFVQTYFLDYSAPVKISISDVKIKQVNDYAAVNHLSDLALLHFNLSADLSPIYNWNVKMLYVFLVAKYETADRGLNEITLWDKYYKRSESHIINEKNRAPLFYFLDDGINLLGKNVTFALRWTVVPNSGYMRNINGDGEIVVKLPSEYIL